MRKFNYRYRMYKGFLTPIVPVRFNYSNEETKIHEGIIDTGSPKILINRDIAKYLNLQLNNWREDKSASEKFKTAPASVDLIIGHAKMIEIFEDIKIRVSEKTNFPELPLIGRYPLFEWYNVNFDNIENRCHLIPK